MADKKIHRVALVGAPCSGKTELLKKLRKRLKDQKIPDTRAIFLKDAWTYFEPFVPALIGIKESQRGGKQLVDQLRSMFATAEVPVAIKTDLQELFPSKEISQLGTLTTLLELYDWLNLDFLQILVNEPELSIRQVMQLQLVRISLELDKKIVIFYQGKPEQNLLIVSDGSAFGPTVYLATDPLDVRFDAALEQVLMEYGIEVSSPMEDLNYGRSFATAANLYEKIILLWTLALKQDEDWWRELYEDGRRLDSPKMAVRIHEDLHKYLQEIELKSPNTCMFFSEYYFLDKIADSITKYFLSL